MNQSCLTIALFFVAVAGACLAEDGNTKVAHETSSAIGAEENSQFELVGVANIPGTALDFSGLDRSLDATTTDNMLGGFSGIAYSKQENVFYFVSDRGPKDGAVDWTCRVQKFRVDISPKSGQPVQIELIDTTTLKNKEGVPFTGNASAFDGKSERKDRFDPEGIRVGSNGSLFVSDEYGPSLIEFASNGNEIRRFEIPSRYQVRMPGSNKLDENATNEFGRQSNRGMEGLAISSDHQTLYGLMQSPLLQDSYRATMSDKPQGLNCRLLRMGCKGEVQGEWIYRLDQNANKLNEILSCGTSTFLVIERDGEVGENARFKKVMLVSATNATDLQGDQRLPQFDQPSVGRTLEKRVFIDLLDPKWGLAGAKMPEKIEGLAFGPDLEDGRATLLIGTDNDFEATADSLVYVFAIPKESLEDWVAAGQLSGNGN